MKYNFRYGWWEKIYYPELIRGFYITSRHFFSNLWKWITGRKGAYTYQYPEEKRPISPNFRGKHYLVLKEDGTPKCVACYMCATNCPAQCIHIVAGEDPNRPEEKYPVEFTIDISRCIFCGYCVEACPKDAIRMTYDYHLADYTREALLYKKEKLLHWIETELDKDQPLIGR